MPHILDSRDAGFEAAFQTLLGMKREDSPDVDAVVAVRGFGKSNQPHKPATKLYNAWLAGVPFIGGNDSAYRAEATPGTDYLVAGSPDEVIDLVLKMRNSPEWRAKIVANGRTRSEEVGSHKLARSWGTLLDFMAQQREKKLRKTELRLASERRFKAALYKADSLRRRD